jgi:hypothetical protein
VVPEEWGLPPTTTLVALGKRLAKHLFALESPTREEDLAISMPAFKQTDATRLAAAVS